MRRWVRAVISSWSSEDWEQIWPERYYSNVSTGSPTATLTHPAATKPASPSLLEDAVDVMRRLADRLMDVTRLHAPTTAEPLIVVLVDELATLTASPTGPCGGGSTSPCGCCQPQGRAVGIVVVGAIQDPRKDVIPQWDLFPVRIGLRVNEAEHVR